MINLKYDLIIVGGGPIGSALAYFSSIRKNELGLNKIALIQMEPKTYEGIAYPYAGGSIRWYFEDEEIQKNTQKTAEFILGLKDKIDLNLIEDNYFFVHRAIFIPALNISGAKLVNYFKKEAELNGIEIYSNTEFQKLEKNENDYRIITSNGEFLAKKVIFALGYKNKEYFNLEELEVEKRQLFVLDINLKEEQLNIPHTIFKFNDGIIFYFLKKFNNGYKIVLGQEEIFKHNNEPVAENYFDDLIKMGLDKHLPFLRNAKLEKILWGFDVKNKKPLINEYDKNIFVVNCGSAVRSIIGIVEKTLEKIK